jgi:phosphoglucosamine mutase
LVTALLPAASLHGWKIVLDTAHGAACVSSRVALESLGASLTLLGNSPDGHNINAGVGSQHPERMVELVRSGGARLGIAHDGDADRCILCDESGVVLDGDEILTLLALHALRQGRLAAKTLVVTVQSNLGVDAAVAAAGGRVSRSQVGDRYVIERMVAEGANLGGESSGHVICSDIAPTGDGLVAALKVIEVMLATGQPLSQLRRALVKFPQLSVAVAVREKKPLASLGALSAAIRESEATLGASGRVLVRYSGTEPKLRLLVEGPNDAVVQRSLDHLLRAAGCDLEILPD